MLKIVEIETGGREILRGEIRQPSSREYILGRSRSACDFVLAENDLELSRQQFTLRLLPDRFVVSNTGKSDCHVSRRKKKLRPGQRVEFRRAATLKAGSTTLKIEYDRSASFVNYELLLQGKGLARPLRIPLEDGRQFTVGASEHDSDVAVPCEGVSKKHLYMEAQGSGLLSVRDLNSRNGLFVKEGKAGISTRVPFAEIKPNQWFAFGSCTATVEAVKPRSRRSIFIWIACIALFAAVLFVMMSGRGEHALARSQDDLARDIQDALSMVPDLDTRIRRLQALLSTSAVQAMPEHESLKRVLLILEEQSTWKSRRTVSERHVRDRLNQAVSGGWHSIGLALEYLHEQIEGLIKQHLQYEASRQLLLQDLVEQDGRYNLEIELCLLDPTSEADVTSLRTLSTSLADLVELHHKWSSREDPPTEDEIRFYNAALSLVDPELGEALSDRLYHAREALIGRRLAWRMLISELDRIRDNPEARVSAVDFPEFPSTSPKWIPTSQRMDWEQSHIAIDDERDWLLKMPVQDVYQQWMYVNRHTPSRLSPDLSESVTAFIHDREHRIRMEVEPLAHRLAELLNMYDPSSSEDQLKLAEHLLPVSAKALPEYIGGWQQIQLDALRKLQTFLLGEYGRLGGMVDAGQRSQLVEVLCSIANAVTQKADVGTDSVFHKYRMSYCK